MIRHEKVIQCSQRVTFSLVCFVYTAAEIFSLSVIYDMVMNVVCFASFDTLPLGCDWGVHHQ